MKKTLNLLSGCALPISLAALICFFQMQYSKELKIYTAAAFFAALFFYFLSGGDRNYRYFHWFLRLLRLPLLDLVLISAGMSIFFFMSNAEEKGIYCIITALLGSIFYLRLFGRAISGIYYPNVYSREGIRLNDAVGKMDGHDFEYFCADILRRNGFRKVSVTRASGDYGADITARDWHGKKWVFQCKRYRGKLGNSPVQEVEAARNYYDADAAAVLTNSDYSHSAETLAERNEVLLIDGEGLAMLNASGHLLMSERKLRRYRHINS